MKIIGVEGLQVNAWLALLNMIPFFGADGNKVLKWSGAAYWMLAIASGAMMFVASYFF